MEDRYVVRGRFLFGITLLPKTDPVSESGSQQNRRREGEANPPPAVRAAGFFALRAAWHRRPVEKPHPRPIPEPSRLGW